MNVKEVFEFLDSREMYMVRYERDDWDRFLKRNSITYKIPYIHIAGSNGKGSTAKYIQEIYKAKGYKVGLFTSPYFYRMNEMISINGEEISDDKIAEIVSKYEKDIGKYNLSKFEVETLIAIDYFNNSSVDVAVIECGMGGEIDSTNIPDSKPLLSIITSVSLEHTNFLGSTVTEIAMNKAGIIKRFSPVLTGHLSEDADTVIRSVAKKNDSDIHVVDIFHHELLLGDKYHFDYGALQLDLNSTAKFMITNATLAIDAVTILNDKLPVDTDAIRAGLLSKPFPCRMERFGNIILDGAHCPEGIEAIMESIMPVARGKHVHTVFACFRDKNIAIELPRLDRDSTDLTITTFPHPRAREMMDYFLYLDDYAYVDDYKEAIEGLNQKYPDDIILVTGSLSFVALVREYLNNK
ncbi:MAG: hypothetical protein MJ238_02680 [Bacilli bacterium]|nr:hypothetical protein [Bacilli bacterium]